MARTAVRTARQHWEAVFSDGIQGDYGSVHAVQRDDPLFASLHAALAHFGDIRGKTVVDLGCGNGGTSLFFASHGAHVLATDLSQSAVTNLGQYCERERIRNISAVQMPAQDVERLKGVDFVFGSMILHHIEPFREFVASLRTAMPSGARGFFFENNARSALMIWFRENCVGRFGIPKFGDQEEFPLMPTEVDLLRNDFQVRIEYPEFYMFRMIPQYLLHDHLNQPCLAVDHLLGRFPKILEYSYRQYIYLS
jgi:SAM-dependent methyltransferase